ncbi:MAG: cysteine-rich CWC family protein [Paludibacteraceae bacterium]|nr:cysteine-rich CWC family protein [Paludibacteraceae bacterium]
MIKKCPRCGKEFECLHDGDISRCECSKVYLTSEALKRIRNDYNDCLCINCLLEYADIKNKGGFA